MLIAMEGPKLDDAESSAVTCQACTEFCSRHKRQNFKQIRAGVFPPKKFFLPLFSASCFFVGYFFQDCQQVLVQAGT